MSAEELLHFGAVYLNEKRVKANAKISEGDLIKIHLQPKRYKESDLNRPPKVHFENSDLLVINKPAPLPTHPTADNLYENLLEMMKAKLGQPLFVTSRLDVETQGLIIFAKTPQAQSKMNRLFKAKRVRKWYQCVTLNKPPSGQLTHFQDPLSAPKRVFKLKQESEQDKVCELIIQSVEPIDDQFLSTIELITGRTHQIRGQFSLMGCPLVGDKIYGEESLPAQHLGLVCTRLQWKWADKLLDLSISDPKIGE